MTVSKIIGWEFYETISFGIYNFNYDGKSIEVARRLVDDKKMKWALCYGGVLTLVPTDYQLKMWENFVQETANGKFEIIK